VGGRGDGGVDESGEYEEMIRQYLVGGISESGQTALEDEGFADRSKYDRILQAEDKLIDDYTRGYLSEAERLRFERNFMATPRRRERVRFARAFTGLLDQDYEAQALARPNEASPLRHPSAPVPLIRSWIDRLRPAMWPAVCAASLLVALGGIWFQRQTAHLHEQLVQAQHERELQRERAPTPEGLVASQNEKNRQLAEELERLRNLQSGGKGPPSSSGFTPASILLTLSLDAFRDPAGGEAPHLVIPRGADLVRLRLKLSENVFPHYQMTLQAADGKEVMSRRWLKAGRTKSGEALMLSIPSAKFKSGEYTLALSGVSDSEVESLGKSNIKVKKQ